MVIFHEDPTTNQPKPGGGNPPTLQDWRPIRLSLHVCMHIKRCGLSSIKFYLKVCFAFHSPLGME